MQIHVKTDHNIAGDDALASWVKSVIEPALDGIADRVTRVEVHLTDDVGQKKTGADHVRCALEARVAGHQPFAVTEHGANVNGAVIAATGKLTRLIDHTLERVEAHRSATEHRP